MSLIEGTNTNTVKIDPPKPIELKKATLEPQTILKDNIPLTIANQTNLNDREFAGSVVKDRLTNTFQTQTNEVFLPIVSNGNSPSDPEKVEAAVSSIRDHLSQGFTDWDVSEGDLNGIRNEFKNLNDAEANAVFDELSNDELKRWADELDGTVGSFNTSEKKTLFDEIAGQLNPQNAARFMNALGDEENIQAFADSYAAKASDQDVENLIGRMDQLVENNEKWAVATAELVSGLSGNPQAIDRVLGGMTQSQIDAVVRAASQQELHSTPSLNPRGGGGSVYTTFDPEPLADFVDAISTSNNPEIKARVFESAANELQRISDSGAILNPTAGRGEATGIIRDSLTRMLQSDTNGVMRELETNFRNGKGITSYARSMFESGNTQELGNIVARLSRGNDLTGNPLERFSDQTRGTDGRPHFQQAQVLGYFAGGLFSAAKQITSNRSDQADMLKNLFGVVAGSAGAANPAAGVASSVINGLTSEIVDSVTKSLNKGTMELEEAIESLIFPRDANTGNLYEGAAEADFDSSFSRVVLRNS